MSLSKAELNKSKSKWSIRETEAQKWVSCLSKRGEKMENRVLVTPTKVCKAKGKCEYVIKFYERALCVCVWVSLLFHPHFSLTSCGFPLPLETLFNSLRDFWHTRNRFCLPLRCLIAGWMRKIQRVSTGRQSDYRNSFRALRNMKSQASWQSFLIYV